MITKSSSKQIVCLSDQIIDETFLQALSPLIAGQLLIIKNIEDLKEMDERREISELFLNTSSVNLQVFENMPRLKLPANQVHYFVDADDRDQLTAIGKREYRDYGGNIVFRSNHDPKSLAECYSLVFNVNEDNDMISTQCSKKLLSPAFQIREVKEKVMVEELLRSFLKKNQCRENRADVICTAMEELIMNAFFNAPVSSSGQFLFRHCNRSENIVPEKDRPVFLQMGISGEYFIGTVTDSYGSLDRYEMLRRIIMGFQSAYQVINRPDEMGSGLGLPLVFRSAGALHFLISPQKKTRVSAIFRIVNMSRKFSERFRFISTYSK